MGDEGLPESVSLMLRLYSERPQQGQIAMRLDRHHTTESVIFKNAIEDGSTSAFN